MRRTGPRSYKEAQAARQKAYTARQAAARGALVMGNRLAVPQRPGGFPGAYQRAGTAKEHKFVDVAAAFYPADTTGTVTLLNGVSQGDDFTNRQGRQVTFTSISIKGILSPVDATTSPCYCRLIVVWDSAQNSGTAPAITDLLVSSTSLSHNNLNNRMRFKVLMDEQYAVGGVQDTATQAYAMSPTVQVINRYLKLPPGCTTTYSGTGATAGAIQSGAIWMFTIGSQAANSGGTYGVATRCRFVDP